MYLHRFATRRYERHEFCAVARCQVCQCFRMFYLLLFVFCYILFSLKFAYVPTLQNVVYSADFLQQAVFRLLNYELKWILLGHNLINRRLHIWISIGLNLRRRSTFLLDKLPSLAPINWIFLKVNAQLHIYQFKYF